MKTRLTKLFLIIGASVFGQEKMPLEQIAFDFYRDSILKINPASTTLTLWTDLDMHYENNIPENCLKGFQYKFDKDSFIV